MNQLGARRVEISGRVGVKAELAEDDRLVRDVARELHAIVDVLLERAREVTRSVVSA